MERRSKCMCFAASFILTSSHLISPILVSSSFLLLLSKKQVEAGTAVRSSGGKPANAFELSFGDTVVVRMRGRAQIREMMEDIASKNNFDLACLSVFTVMGDTRDDWNGLSVAKIQGYTGTVCGVLNEAALRAWVVTRKP